MPQPHRLKRLLRNGIEILKFVKPFAHSPSAFQKMIDKISHDFKGKVNRVPVPSINLSVVEEQIENALKTHSFRDIAVLYSKKDDIPAKLSILTNSDDLDDCEPTKMVKIGEFDIRIGDACCNNLNAMVVDSVRCYSNLERPVVIVVNPVATFASQQALNYIAFSRANSELIVIIGRTRI